MNADACLRDAKQSVEHPILSADTTHLIRVHYSESTIPTRKSNEYEYEYGLFLYNATRILDNPSNFVHS